MIELPTLGGGQTTPRDVNNVGDIVGDSVAPGPDLRACLWRNGSIIDLNDLLPANSGWVLRQALAINDAGQIAGTGERSGQNRAFILTPATCPGWVVGDMNCDGTVSFLDINPFVLALAVPDAYALLYPYCNWLCNCDVNRDGLVNFADINPFVALLTGQ